MEVAREVSLASRDGHRMRDGVVARYRGGMSPHKTTAPLLRVELGDVLRMVRKEQGATLRDVSARAQVSLGYLSEVERGQKEASSELLEAICAALGVPLWVVLREVSDRMAMQSGVAMGESVGSRVLADVTLIS